MIDEEEELEEQDVPSPLPPNIDGVGLAVGSGHFVQNHRFSGLHINIPGGQSPRLTVSRYYWDLEPPVAVDFVRDLRFGPLELATKKAHFATCNVRYILVQDAFDGEGAEAALAGYAESQEGEIPPITAGQVLTGPRRKRN